MIKYIGVGIAGLALVGCTQAAPAPVVTVTAPAPTVTVEPEPENNQYQGLLNYAWGELSSSERSDLCDLYNSAPEYAWSIFEEGLDDPIPRSEFDTFFDSKCSDY